MSRPVFTRSISHNPQAKPRAVLIFADLDGTFTPMDIGGWIDFAEVIGEINDRENAQVKFIPVSGRPAGYVLRVLHSARDNLKGEGITGVCDYGAAEQGALLVDSSRSYGPKFTGRPESVGLKAEIAKIIENNEYAPIVSDEPDKLYTCSIHITNEAKENMTHDEQFKVYNSIKSDIVAKYGEGTLSIAMSHNCMEVMTREISKANAISMLIDRYRKDFNIVGLLYAGDAENDKIAMMYISRLAEIPGCYSHNFTPANAQDAIGTHHIDAWKRKKGFGTHYVQKGSKKLFRGITELIRNAMDEGCFCDIGVESWEVRDDSHLSQLISNSSRSNKRAKSVERLSSLSETDENVY